MKTPAQKVLYKKTPQEGMYLHVLRPSAQNRSPLPAIVYFTGGGWVNGSVEDQLPVAAWWRDYGIIAIVADYRVANRHQTTPMECIADAKSAMRFVRAHAAEWGIDPDKIIAAGGSAGGHLAACTFLDGGDEPGEDTTISTKPNALVLHNPVLGEGFGQTFFAQNPEFSPLHHTELSWPPVILSHGTADSVVPYSASENFQQRMIRAENRCEIISLKDAEHSCDWPVSNTHFQPTVQKMAQFLKTCAIID